MADPQRIEDRGLVARLAVATLSTALKMRQQPCYQTSNSRLVENRSDTVGKEQLASLAFRSDSMLAVDGCSLVFLEGRVFN